MDSLVMVQTSFSTRDLASPAPLPLLRTTSPLLLAAGLHPMAEAWVPSQCHRWMCKEALSLSNPFGKLFSRTEDGVGVESAEGCELRCWQPGRMGVKAGLLGSELI